MVSTRPIKRLRYTEDETDLVLTLREPLAHLAALPPALTTGLVGVGAIPAEHPVGGDRGQIVPTRSRTRSSGERS